MRITYILPALMVISAGLSCSSPAPDDHGHDHGEATAETAHEDHGPEPLAYTRYSDRTELFVEFMPLVVGQVTTFAAHFTVLGETFKPLTEGRITVSLIVGSDGIRYTADSASSPGIFRLALKPGMGGRGKLVYDIETEAYTDRITIDGVTVYPSEAEAAADAPHGPDADAITYLKEQAWKVDFANAPARSQPFSDVIRTAGTILPAPGDEVVVSAKSDGIVRFTGSGITPGAAVRAGSALFRITGGDVAQGNIDARYRQAAATYNRTKADYDRARELVADQIISERDFLDAKLAFENAQTEYELIGKNYSDGGQSNASPIDGFIRNIAVSDGQYVTAGTPLAVVARNRKLLLQANVSQKYFGLLPLIASANFRIPGDTAVYDTRALGGKVVSYGRSTAGNSLFLPVIFEVDNRGGFVPGTAVEFFLKTAPAGNVLTVPASALIEEQGIYSVYVQTAGERFEKREVKTGESDGQRVQVFSGVEEGERVVTKGAYQIKLSSASGELPAHGHSH